MGLVVRLLKSSNDEPRVLSDEALEGDEARKLELPLCLPASACERDRFAILCSPCLLPCQLFLPRRQLPECQSEDLAAAAWRLHASALAKQARRSRRPRSAKSK